jgi:nucleoside 2-deoxyribosyltransferase
MLFYISGKITGTDDYLERFAAAEEQLKTAGHVVINPAKMHSEWAEGVDYDELMLLCFKEIDLADGVYQLADWKDSKGACMEYGYAVAKDKLIIEEECVMEGGVENGSI